MRQLIVLDLPAGDSFVDRLRRAWDDGDAVLPVDRRLPDPAKQRLYELLRPSVVVSEAGEISLARGIPVEDGDAVVVATSGTTGNPKGVVLTHDSIEASAVATSERLAVTNADHWLACLPLSHVGGLSVVLRALHLETSLTVHDGFDANAVERAARDGANLVSLVATAMARIDTSLFTTIVLGGAKPPDDRPSNTVITYGMTETGSGVVYDRRPLNGVEVRIVDGEVQLRCPMLLRCYRGGDEFEHDPKTADGWFPTGDLGSFDNGELQIEGRRGDLIISGGENVWPDPVEAAIARLPGVDEVAVAGVADPEWGQAVTAFVVADGPPPTLEQVRMAVKQELPAFCAPREVLFVDSLPRTSLGKVQRAVLSRSAPEHRRRSQRSAP